jgi:hypothetical protein
MKLTTEDIARITHETNRAYCLAIADASQVSWSDAPAWQRESAMVGVTAVLIGVANTPEEQHENWLEQKRRDGWTYGPVKDADAKTHPCFLPYALLPAEQKAKDHLFRAVVKALLDAGIEVAR